MLLGTGVKVGTGVDVAVFVEIGDCVAAGCCPDLNSKAPISYPAPCERTMPSKSVGTTDPKLNPESIAGEPDWRWKSVELTNFGSADNAASPEFDVTFQYKLLVKTELVILLELAADQAAPLVPVKILFLTVQCCG